MSDTQQPNPERQRLETLLDSAPLREYLSRAARIDADPSEPLVAEFCGLRESGELGVDAMFEDFWRAARLNGRPVSAGVERLLNEAVRAQAAADLTAAWTDIPAADRDRASVVRDGLLDPSVSAVFLGLLHGPVVEGLARAADERSGQLRLDNDNLCACAEAVRTHTDRVEGKALNIAIPTEPTTLAEAEYVLARALRTDENEAWAALARGGASCEAWIMREVEGDYTLDGRMLRLIEALLQLNPARALRIAGGLFRIDEAGGVDQDTNPEQAARYADLLTMILARNEPEVLPLLIFIMEPQGNLRPDRETAANLRRLIRESSWFRKVRRMLRRLQAGEPVLVPAGVDFEGFARSELSRLGYTDTSPDPQVLTGIRERWLHAMHEDLLYHSPSDIPEVSFADALGEISDTDRNAGDIVSEKTTTDPDWILKPADNDPDGTPRIVRAYQAQQAVYSSAGLDRVQHRQLDMTVRDLVMRSARSHTSGETARAILLMEAARGLSPEHAAVTALSPLILQN